MKKYFVVLLLVLVFPSLVYGDQIFDEICTEIKEKATPLRLTELGYMYKGRSLSGEGYLFKVTKSAMGNGILHLATEKDFDPSSQMIKDLDPYQPIVEDPDSPAVATVMIFLKKEDNDKASELTKGDLVRFSGTLMRITLNKVIIQNGKLE